jgi:hypothetical protein
MAYPKISCCYSNLIILTDNKKRKTLEDDVKINRKFEVEAVVFGSSPNSNINGAMIIPPPTPSIPLITPPRKHTKIILFIILSPSAEDRLKSP